MPKSRKSPGPVARSALSQASKVAAKGPLVVAGQLWLQIDEIAFLGEERIALLEQIDACGSITRAAQAVGISYKAAWDAVDAMNTLAPSAVVVTATGGRGGGGTRLTDEGHRLIAAFRTIAAEYRRFLADVNAALDDAGVDLNLLRRLSLHSSARNQFFGRVVAVSARMVDAEVEFELPGDHRLRAGITNESVESLGLRPGREVWALVKAVAVAIEHPSAPTPAGFNRLCGEVERITRSDGPAEVVLALAGGVRVSGVIAAEQLAQHGIREGEVACALFSGTSVIVGISD
ncbi:TOBE domain-containing protein [Thiorhodovibrio frisius]|uniref:Molybdenum-pterin binding domain protein n=1 Tax=Thiorhodovibrio frisius TaxID=631362 RepID=H8YXL1_9GAMM|nr:TOBE domain-containing protein [Thiorhodovibrio frisius]EIC23187.1 molybdenum-pterin binding domain protein [Thiorhodovibrio frisius]WPL22542.1 Molybdenum-pterin-binding protein MopA [Thiorhodovibrio frisius]